MQDQPTIVTSDAAPREPSLFDVKPIETWRYNRDKPLGHRLAIDSRGHVVGRYSIWHRHTPRSNGRALGCIGHYAATDATTAREMLECASRELEQFGCDDAVAPMDGNTWRPYRVVTHFGDEPTFFMEPTNPRDWADHFVGAGFKAIAHYVSSRVTQPLAWSDRLGAVAARIEQQDIRIRPLELSQYEAELGRIHAVSLEAFAGAPFFTPIDWWEFLQLYQPLQSFIEPRLVQLAERAGEIVGFAFAVPDYCQRERGEAIDQMIVKTVAVRPDRRLAGLGHLLTHRCQAAGWALGYRRAVHALMHESNRSRQLGGPSARVIRRYALFGRELTP